MHNVRVKKKKKYSLPQGLKFGNQWASITIPWFHRQGIKSNPTCTNTS